MNKNLELAFNEVIHKVIEWRRHLHMNPELSFEEKETSQFVYDTLSSFNNLEISRPTETSVVAVLRGGESTGKMLGLRADMDALPITEETQLDFASKKEGIMHACGHDAHTAMLLGAAKILSENYDKLQGDIKFIFQHAEELLPGGAQEMVKEGVADDLDYVAGLHVMSHLDVGKIGIVYGNMTSNTDVFDLRVTGKGGHSSQPENSVDPVVIGSQIVNNLQHVVSRNVSPSDELVISITEINGGTAKNVIPEYVDIGASIRSYNPDVREKAVQSIERIIKGVTEAHEADYEFNYTYGYSSVVNNENLTKIVESVISEEFGSQAIEYPEPIMGGEDFSAFSEKVPGCFVAIGAKNDDMNFNFPHHHPRFGIDEQSLENGLRLLINLPQKVLIK